MVVWYIVGNQDWEHADVLGIYYTRKQCQKDYDVVLKDWWRPINRKTDSKGRTKKQCSEQMIYDDTESNIYLEAYSSEIIKDDIE